MTAVRMRAFDAIEFTPEVGEQVATLSEGGTLDHPDPEVLLISTMTALTRADVDSMPSLRHVALCGTSKGRLDLDALAERGITVSNVTHYGDHPVAEFVFHHLVALFRGWAGQM